MVKSLCSKLIEVRTFLKSFKFQGKSGEDFVWEIKSNSIQNSAWIDALKKTEVTSNPEEYGDY